MAFTIEFKLKLLYNYLAFSEAQNVSGIIRDIIRVLGNRDGYTFLILKAEHIAHTFAFLHSSSLNFPGSHPALFQGLLWFPTPLSQEFCVPHNPPSCQGLVPHSSFLPIFHPTICFSVWEIDHSGCQLLKTIGRMGRAEMEVLLCWKVLIRCQELHVFLFLLLPLFQFSPKPLGFCPLMLRTFPEILELSG